MFLKRSYLLSKRAQQVLCASVTTVSVSHRAKVPCTMGWWSLGILLAQAPLLFSPSCSDLSTLHSTATLILRLVAFSGKFFSFYTNIWKISKIFSSSLFSCRVYCCLDLIACYIQNFWIRIKFLWNAKCKCLQRGWRLLHISQNFLFSLFKVFLLLSFI